jgi:hypothetical protein
MVCESTHTTKNSIWTLWALFNEWMISRPWPSGMADLNVCHIYLQGNLKHNIYRHNPCTSDTLQIEIKHFFKLCLIAIFTNLGLVKLTCTKSKTRLFWTSEICQCSNILANGPFWCLLPTQTMKIKKVPLLIREIWSCVNKVSCSFSWKEVT